MSVISMKQLLEAGVHFGHQTRRWNPKMAPYIFTERNGIHIIDLQKSVVKVDEAYKAVSEIAAQGGTISRLHSTYHNAQPQPLQRPVPASWYQRTEWCRPVQQSQILPCKPHQP